MDTASNMKRGRREGFTLVEVIISSMIFFIVSIGFTAGILAALKTNSMAGFHYRATCIARNQIQHARTLAFDAVRQLQTNAWVNEDGLPVVVSNEGLYFMSTTVFYPSGMVDTVDIKVQVSFPQPFGKWSTRPVELQTMINRRW